MISKIIFSSALFLCSNLAFSQFTDEINCNRPGESMGAFSVGKTVIQVEGGMSHINTKHKNLKYKTSGMFGDMALRYGAFLEQLEFVGNITYQMDKFSNPVGDVKRNGFKNLTLGAKYLLFDPYMAFGEDKPNLYSWKANHSFKWKSLIPVVSIYAGANFDVKNEFLYRDEPQNTISPKVMLITQNNFAKGVVLVTNIFADRIATDNKSYGFIATITKGFNENWSGFFENKFIKNDYYSDGIITAGAAYLFDKTLQFDASISKNVKYTPSVFYFGIGAAWRYDLKYQEVRIFKNLSDQDKKMQNKKEKEEKKRKRKDVVE